MHLPFLLRLCFSYFYFINLKITEIFITTKDLTDNKIKYKAQSNLVTRTHQGCCSEGEKKTQKTLLGVFGVSLSQLLLSDAISTKVSLWYEEERGKLNS